MSTASRALLGLTAEGGCPYVVLAGASVQAQLRRDWLHGFDAECDVFVEIDTQARSAVHDVFSIHFAGEGFVFHSFSH
jgi:hypothetical protein